MKMRLVTFEQWERALCVALDLRPELTTELTIHLKAGEVPTVTAVCLTDQAQYETVVKEFVALDWAPKPAEEPNT